MSKKKIENGRKKVTCFFLLKNIQLINEIRLPFEWNKSIFPYNKI